MFDSILVVCTGNICRSPMAAGLLRHAVGAGDGAPRVDSVGLAAMTGEPADPLAVRLLAGRGVDIRAHRAMQVTDALLRRSALILVMERVQQESIENRWPMLHGRVYRWGHWQDFDVQDPFGRGEQAFHAALALIERALPDWRQRLQARRAGTRIDPSSQGVRSGG